MKTYRLYALPLNSDFDVNERFIRINGKYILIYTEKEYTENAVQITDNEAHRLSTAESDWLFRCNSTIIAEEMVDRKEEIASALAESLDKLELALAEEQAKEVDNGNSES